MWGSPGVCVGSIPYFLYTSPLGDIVRAHGLAITSMQMTPSYQCSDSKMRRFGKITDFISQKYNTVFETTQ